MSVRVAVRVRPFSERELALQTENVINMVDNTTFLRDERDRDGESRSFTFDHSFWYDNHRLPCCLKF